MEPIVLSTLQPIVCDGLGIVAQVPLRKAILLGVQLNTGLDGGGKITPVAFGGPRGSILVGCHFKAIEATSSSNVLRLYLGHGSTLGLLDEIIVTAITPNATTKSWAYWWQPEGGPITIPQDGVFACSLEVADSMYAHPEGGHF